MREDEEFVKEVIIEKYLSKYNSYEIIEGNRNEPPDYRIIIDSSEILLEITQCTSIVLQGNSSITSTKNINYPILKIEDELVNDFAKVELDYCFTIRIRGPIKNLNSFKKELKEYLKLILKNNQFDSFTSFQKVILTTEEVKIKAAKKEVLNSRSFKIIAWIKCDNHEYDIQKHINLALVEALKIKNIKLKKFSEKKWLGILNDYFLASLETYERVFNSGIETYDFDKIFIVDKNKNLLVISNSK